METTEVKLNMDGTVKTAEMEAAENRIWTSPKLERTFKSFCKMAHSEDEATLLNLKATAQRRLEAGEVTIELQAQLIAAQWVINDRHWSAK